MHGGLKSTCLAVSFLGVVSSYPSKFVTFQNNSVDIFLGVLKSGCRSSSRQFS